MTQNETIASDEGGIDRRRLLKGAVAAGVGVVAWSSPSISSIGGTPAYAAVCTGGYEDFTIDYRNTACNCGSGSEQNKYASYKDPYNESSCAVDSAPRQVALYQGNATTYPLITNSGTCPPAGTEAAGAYARIYGGGGSDDFNFCRLRVDSMKGNCDTGEVVASAYTNTVEMGQDEFVALPKVLCQASGNIFLRIVLECADDDACFPTTIPTTPTIPTTKPGKP